MAARDGDDGDEGNGSDCPRARVWVDDRHSIFRRGLVSCIGAEGFDVVGESSGFTPPPDLDVVDVLVFEADRAQVRTAVQLTRGTDIALVAVLGASAESMVAEVVGAGVAGVLPRATLGPATLVAAMRAALAGTIAIPSALVPRLFDRDGVDPRRSGVGLNDRELAALQLLSNGYETREIAEELCYSERTVKNIVHDLMTKLNCRNRAQVVAVAARHGVI